jgi:nitrous oxide reductase accessory protein NosL
MKTLTRFLFFSLFFFLSFSGCEKKPIGTPDQMHWDRDMCERCKMAISERKYAAQIIDPASGKVYKFDDIGCAILWMEEGHVPWKDQAIIWVTDASTGEWLDARSAKYTDDSITPMAYGIAAYSEKTFPSGKEALDYATIVKKVHQIEAINQQKVRSYR